MFRFVNKLKNRKGFTLIELLVVLAVLAIIALIAVPKFTGIRENAKKDADARTAEMIEKALKLAVVSENLSTSADAGVVLCTISTTEFENKEAAGLTDTKLANYLDVKLNSSHKDANLKLQSSGTYTFKLEKSGDITVTH